MKEVHRNRMQPQRDSIARLRSLTHLLDNAIGIPGTRYRVGIDPIVGLLPGGGDFVMAFFSAYILLEAARFGLPRATLLRMLWNLILDALLGTVPIAGDFFDVAWKANTRNLALIEAHLASSNQQTKADYLFVWLLILVFFALIIAIGALVVFVISAIWQAISS